MSITTTMITILVLISVATGIRIVLGPTIWDRLLGLNLFSSKIIILIVLYALLKNESYYLDIAIVYVLLGFISIISIARFIQKKGKI